MKKAIKWAEEFNDLDEEEQYVYLEELAPRMSRSLPRPSTPTLPRPYTPTLPRPYPTMSLLHPTPPHPQRYPNRNPPSPSPNPPPTLPRPLPQAGCTCSSCWGSSALKATSLTTRYIYNIYIYIFTSRTPPFPLVWHMPFFVHVTDISTDISTDIQSALLQGSFDDEDDLDDDDDDEAGEDEAEEAEEDI